MEENLKKALKDDEKLLWSGQPEKFETFDKTYKPLFIRKLVISLLVGIFLSVGYFILSQKSEAEIKWGFLVLVWLFCVISPVNVFRDANSLRKNTVYAMTDRRLFTVIDSTTVRDITLAQIEKASFLTDEDGHVSLFCGKEGKKPDNNLRSITLTVPSINEETDKCERYVMYAVPQADKLRKLLKDYISIGNL